MATYPAAFALCNVGVCPGVTMTKNKGKDSWTVTQAATPATTCSVPCGCHLFSTGSDVAAGEENWDWEPDPSNVFKADQKKFEWICVQPVLGGTDTVCAKGSCAAPISRGKGDDETIRCQESAACKAPCKCVLFQWERGSRKKKWERAEGLPHKPDDVKYIYWCICIN